MTRRSAILANLLLSLSIVSGLLGTAPSASAQTTMKATIPFDFLVGNHRMAAGSYSVERLSSYSLLVRNNTTSRSVAFLVRTETGPSAESRGHLTFQRYGRTPYLTQAWFEGTTLHADVVPKPRGNVEYAKGSAQASPIEVASAR